MNKVLVTGATGHVGNTLVKELKTRGYDVYALVMPFDNINHIKEDARIVYGNILDKEGLTYLFNGMDYIIHTAGLIDIGSGNKTNIYNVNINGTLNVMAAAHRNNIKRVIYTSSVHALPVLKHGRVMREIDRYDPKTVTGNYAKSKAIATQKALDYAKKHNLDLVVVLLAGIIGANDYKDSHMGEVVRRFMEQKLPFYIKGGYNYVDVKDAANGIALALEKGRRFESYILSGNYITIKQYLNIIAFYAHKKPPKRAINYNFILIMSKLAELYYIIAGKKMLISTYSVRVLRSNANFSNEKAVKELGWTIRPFEETARDIVRFIENTYNTM